MMVWAPGPDALQLGTLLWERKGIACRLLRHASRPFFEIRLVGSDGLVAQELFDSEVAAALYALDQMHARAPDDAE